ITNMISKGRGFVSPLCTIEYQMKMKMKMKMKMRRMMKTEYKPRNDKCLEITNMISKGRGFVSCTIEELSHFFVNSYSNLNENLNFFHFFILSFCHFVIFSFFHFFVFSFFRFFVFSFF